RWQFKGLPAGLTRKGPLRGGIGQRYCGPFSCGSGGTGPRRYWAEAGRAEAGCGQTLRPATLFSPRTELHQVVGSKWRSSKSQFFTKVVWEYQLHSRTLKTDEICADSRYHFDLIVTCGSRNHLRFLVPRDMTVGHFIHMLSNRLHRTISKALTEHTSSTAAPMDSLNNTAVSKPSFKSIGDESMLKITKTKPQVVILVNTYCSV
ncbi:hypothetical protein HID58_001516, partial [Brassica napus]